MLAWAKKNPLLAGLAGLGLIVFVVLTLSLITLLRGSSGPSPRDLTSLEQEPSMPKRIKKLVDIEQPSVHLPSKGYQRLMTTWYEALTHTDATAEDLVALARVAHDARDLTNEDFAWAVVIETNLRRGVWPKYPELPPKDAEVAALLRDTLKNTRVEVTLPKDLAVRDAWLRFAVQGHELERNPKAQPGPLLGEFYKEQDGSEAHLLLYQQLTGAGPGAHWLQRRIYDELGLLPEPIFVLDSDTSPGPTVARGPENTLMFLGALSGDRCAIAVDASALPPLWVRPCRGLEPRRLARGELFLIGVDVKYDQAAPMHWLPILVDDKGQVTLGDNLRAKVDDRVLASFMVAAPRFVLDGKSLRPFTPPLALVSATLSAPAPVTIPSFRTTASSRAATAFVGFSTASRARPAKACAKLDNDRCAALRAGSTETKCELTPPACVELPGGAMVRWARSTLVHTEPCLKEYGRKSECPFSAKTGVVVDVRPPKAREFLPGPYVIVHDKPLDGE